LQDQKISKLKDQMVGTKTNEQYRAFQNEIEFCQKDIRKLEDRILEMMSESEPLEKNVKAAEAALKAEKAQVEAEKALARQRTAVDQKAAGELQVERASIAKEIPAATYQQYERVRKGRRGIAVAEVVDGRCTACYITLRPQYYQDVKRTEKILFCESCQRILYYNPPQAFDDLAGSEGGTPAGIGE
jgi:predicted  nucleic acid-binding Zn-ribbon protein